MAETNRAWIFEQRPVGDDFDSALKFREHPMPANAGPDQVLVRNLYLSLDPANRRWMAGPTYMPPIPTGGPMWGFVVGRVIVNPTLAGFAPGDAVGGVGTWADYSALSTQGLDKIPDLGGLPLHAAVGLFRGPGGTAYVGVKDIGQLKPGQTFVVSGAAGSVGSKTRGRADREKSGCGRMWSASPESNEKCALVDRRTRFRSCRSTTRPKMSSSACANSARQASMSISRMSAALLATRLLPTWPNSAGSRSVG